MLELIITPLLLCQKPVKVWAIDRNTYRKILMSLQRQKREKYDEVLKKVMLINFLKIWLQPKDAYSW